MLSHPASLSSLKTKRYKRLRPKAHAREPSILTTPNYGDDASLKSDARADATPGIKIGIVSRFFKNNPKPEADGLPISAPEPERPSSPPWDIDWVAEGLSSPPDENDVGDIVCSRTEHDNLPIMELLQSPRQPGRHEQIRAQIDSPGKIPLPDATEKGVEEDLLSMREADIFEQQASDQYSASLTLAFPSQHSATPLHAHPVLPDSKLLNSSINTLSELGTYPHELHNPLYQQSSSQMSFSDNRARHPISYPYRQHESVADAPDYAASAIPEVFYVSDGNSLSGFGDGAPFAEVPVPQDPHAGILQFRGGSDGYATSSAPPPREDGTTIYLRDNHDQSGQHSMDISDDCLSTDEPFPDDPRSQLSILPNERRHYFIEDNVQEMKYGTYLRDDDSTGDVNQGFLTDAFPADQADGGAAIFDEFSAICEVEACLECGGTDGSDANRSEDFSLDGVPGDSTRVFDAHPSRSSFFPDERFYNLEARRQPYSVPGSAIHSSSSEQDDPSANTQKADIGNRMPTFQDTPDRPRSNQRTHHRYRNNGKNSSSHQQCSREAVPSPSSSPHLPVPRQRFQQGRALLLGLNDMGPALINNSGWRLSDDPHFLTDCIESDRIQDHVARTLERKGYWNRGGVARHI